MLPDVKKDLVCQLRGSNLVHRDPQLIIQIHRYVVTNDGIPFRPEDWARLKKIAEGNPDESKIGQLHRAQIWLPLS